MNGYDFTLLHSETGFTSQMVHTVDTMPQHTVARYLRVYFTGL